MAGAWGGIGEEDWYDAVVDNRLVAYFVVFPAVKAGAASSAGVLLLGREMAHESKFFKSSNFELINVSNKD